MQLVVSRVLELTNKKILRVEQYFSPDGIGSNLLIKLGGESDPRGNLVEKENKLCEVLLQAYESY
jgi:hypothetical protein